MPAVGFPFVPFDVFPRAIGSVYMSWENPEKISRACGSAVCTASAAAVLWICEVNQSTGSATFAAPNSLRKLIEARFG